MVRIYDGLKEITLRCRVEAPRQTPVKDRHEGLVQWGVSTCRCPWDRAPDIGQSTSANQRCAALPCAKKILVKGLDRLALNQPATATSIQPDVRTLG